MSEYRTPEVEAPDVPEPTEPPGDAWANPSTQPRRLERIDHGRWVAGVATGLADYFAVPVWLVRVLFVLFLAPGGIGVLLYLALIVFMPHESEDQSPADRWFGDLTTTSKWVGALLAVVGGMVVVGGLTNLDGGFVIALGLIAVGVLLFQGRIGSDRSGTVPEGTDGSILDTGAPVEPGVVPPAPPQRPQRDPRPPREPRPPRPPREPSHLGALTIAAVLVVQGLLASAHIAGWLFPDTLHYVAAALITIGAGLLVGAWLGRSRGLILLGIALLPFLAASLVFSNANRIVDFVAAGRVDRTVVVDRVEDVRFIEAGAGRLLVDLRNTEWPADGTGDVVVRLAAGELTLLLPDGVAARARVGVGEIADDGATLHDGFDLFHSFGDPLGPTVVAELGVGRIEIQGGTR